MVNCAFLIGCAKYTAEQFNTLESVGYDIVNMKDALVEYCGCSEENIFIISDTVEAAPRPTGNEICSTLLNRAKAFSKDKINNLFFYYSGHGFISSEKKEAVIVPTDTIIEPIVHGTISLPDITHLLQESFYSVDNIIFILDMCLSDNLFAKGTFKADEKINIESFSAGVIVFYSCSPWRNSYMVPPNLEGELGKGSVYTNVFIDALKDKNCFTVENIEAFVSNRINYYNSRTGNAQKPFAAYQSGSLKDVPVKRNNLPLPEKVTIDEYQRYLSSNTLNAQLSDKEILMVVALGKQINLSDLNGIATYGYSSMRKIDQDIKENYEQKVSSINFDEYTRAREKILSIYNEVNPSPSFFRSLSRFFQSIDINEEDTALEGAVNCIDTAIDTSISHFHKNAINLDKYMRKIEDYNKEMSMFYVAGKYATNLNQDTDSSLLNYRLNQIKEYHAFLKDHLPLINEMAQKSHENALRLIEYQKLIPRIKELLYNDKSSDIYKNRYNETRLADLLGILDQIETIVQNYTELNKKINDHILSFKERITGLHLS